MIAGENKAIELETDFLDEALSLAREIVALRGRLASARRDHAELLEQRDKALHEGRDLLPRIRELFLEIDELPAQISEREQAARWLIEQNVATVNAENRQRSAQVYINARDVLRTGLEQLRIVLTCAEESMRRGTTLGEGSLGLINAKLAEVEKILAVGPLPRVIYQPHLLPSIQGAFASRNELLSAIDGLISGLR